MDDEKVSSDVAHDSQNEDLAKVREPMLIDGAVRPQQSRALNIVENPLQVRSTQ
jgi:hypothetical protein